MASVLGDCVGAGVSEDCDVVKWTLFSDDWDVVRWTLFRDVSISSVGCGLRLERSHLVTAKLGLRVQDEIRINVGIVVRIFGHIDGRVVVALMLIIAVI